MSGLRFTNTYSRAVEPFQPLAADGRTVLMYSCGPTVYSYAHIGNFRTFLFADLLRRVLERRGFAVRQVMNITDVGHLTQDDVADATGEDKLAKAARALGWDPFRVAQHFLDAFERDARTLRLRNYSPGEDRAELHPRATRFIPEMLAMIEGLIDRGHAYADADGNVYFSIETFPEYGNLSGKVIDELESGSRVAVRSEKRDPRDFALWKVDAGHLMQWDPHSPEGWPEEDWARLAKLLPKGVRPEIKRGFPGWHIECSAMSLACLAEVIDIHTGGEDNVFPHHECELAQTCCALDVKVPGPTPEEAPRRSFARFWIHSRHLLVDGKKMSKRDGTFFTVRELLDPVESGRPELVERLKAVGFEDGKAEGADLRLALMWGRYNQPMNFSLDLLGRARRGRLRVQVLYDRALELAKAGEAPAEPIAAEARAALEAFDQGLADDLNIDRAMAVVFDYVTKMNSAELGPGDAQVVQATLESFDQALDVLVRRRMGFVSAADLAAWCTPDFRVDRAAALDRWKSEPARSAFHAALAAGELPAPDALPALGEALTDEEVDVLLGVRHGARKAKRFDVADAIRDRLRALGLIVEDSPNGVRWKQG